MIRALDGWFFDRLGRHKALNRSAGWRVFEAEGDDVYGIWTDEFGRLGVTEAEADAASHRMARESSRFPEHHLARLVALVRDARAKQDAIEAKADRDELAERDAWAKADFAVARAGWDQLPAAERDARTRSIRQRYPGIGTCPRLVWHYAIDEWRGLKLPDPSGFSADPRPEPPRRRVPAAPVAPPALPPERLSELTHQAEAKRRGDLERLQAMQQRRTAQQPPPAAPADLHPTNVAI